LTQQISNPTTIARDRPNSTEIEITPKMIEAGIAVVRSREYELWEATAPDELTDFVLTIYRAMSIVSENGSAKGI
jgi:hypothetical protein